MGMLMLVIALVIMSTAACGTPSNLHTNIELDSMPEISAYGLLWEYDSNHQLAARMYEGRWFHISGNVSFVESDAYFLYPDHVTIAAFLHDGFDTSMYSIGHGDQVNLVCQGQMYISGKILNMVNCYIPKER